MTLHQQIGIKKPDFKDELVPEQVLLNMKIGEKAKFGELEIELLSVSKSKIENVPFTFKIYYKGKAKKILLWRNSEMIGTLGYGTDWICQLLRDIESVLVLDKLNENNPFHEPSDFMKIYNR